MSIPQKLILLVEDDKINAKLLRDFLKFKGYEIVQLDNGLDVLPKLGEIKPDLILMDLRIFGRSGVDVAKDLRAIEEYREMPIFAISALPRDKTLSEAEKTLFDEYVEKPITFEQFIPMIEAYIGKGKE